MSASIEQLRQRAMAHQARGDFRGAVDGYRQLLDQHSGEPDDWYNLAYSLRQTGQFEAALAAYDEALRMGVSQPEEVHLNRAAILSSGLNRDDEARVALTAALEHNPRYSAARLNLGNLMEEMGQRDEALTCYRRLQDELPESDPIRLEALARMAHLDPPLSAEDPRLEVLELAANRAGIDPVAKSNLCLALARTCDRLGLHDRAFLAMKAGKQVIARQGPRYQPQRLERLVDALIDAFPGPSRSETNKSAEGPRPVFILGMYRSGSTLVEQVLSAHSGVVTGGELDLLPRLVAHQLQPFPRAAANLEPQSASRLAEEYLQAVRSRLPEAPTADIVTDKRPPNFLLIGVIQRLFSDARIIHTVRNPLDNALSIYMQNLDSRVAPYASDLVGIGHYYLQYRQLMAHWRSVFPGMIHEVSYDRLVSQPEPVIRSVLEFLGLEWESACLAFHQSRATVRTASYWQVRQPLYKSASGRWRRYRRHLEGLRKQLIEAGLSASALDSGG